MYYIFIYVLYRIQFDNDTTTTHVVIVQSRRACRASRGFLDRGLIGKLVAMIYCRMKIHLTTQPKRVFVLVFVPPVDTRPRRWQWWNWRRENPLQSLTPSRPPTCDYDDCVNDEANSENIAPDETRHPFCLVSVIACCTRTFETIRPILDDCIFYVFRDTVTIVSVDVEQIRKPIQV